MGRERGSNSWFSSWWRMSKKSMNEPEKTEVGILAYEVVSLMSKVVKLWNCLSDREVARLKEDISNSIGIKKLVSDNGDYLMDLALNEIVESVGMVARSVVRLGKKCADPVYQRLELFWNDPDEYDSEWYGWEYKWKKMEGRVKKMERFVAAMEQLSQEFEVLSELEQTLRGMHGKANVEQVKLLECQQKVLWQRQEVKNLQDMSPWTRSYDYIVRLLTRSLFTILERIKHVFGTSQVPSILGNNDCELVNAQCLPRSHSFSALMQSSVHPFESNLFGLHSGPLGRSILKSGLVTGKNGTKKIWKSIHNQSSNLHGKHKNSKSKRFANVGPLKGCMMGGSESPVLQSCKPAIGGSMRLSSTNTKSSDTMRRTTMGSLSCSDRLHSKISLFNSSCGLLHAPPGTLGDAALALQYANVIVLIERLASAPHLISLDARNDLYNMLPTSIKTALRARLKSYAKTLALPNFHPSLATEWSLALVRILEWLAPLAHNMIRWQSERNFEKQQVAYGANILLVQTLYFATLSKTEAAITELLVGLNYVCRIGGNPRKPVLPSSATCRASNANLIQEGDVAYSVMQNLSQ